MKRRMLTTILFITLTHLALAEEGRGPQAGKPRPKPRPFAQDNQQTPPPVDRYLHHLEQKDPAEYEKLKKLRQEDPREFRRALREKAMSRRHQNFREDGPRVHPLTPQLKAVKEAETDAEREQAIAALRTAVENQVDANLKRREDRLNAARAQLKKLEEQQQKDLQEREALVDKHLERLLDSLNPPTP
jgi:hypothetical protein